MCGVCSVPASCSCVVCVQYLRVVHEGFDAADERGVDLRLCRLIVHRAEEVEDAGQTIQVYEARHKPAEVKGDTCLRKTTSDIMSS